jgi:hypothetical protein
MLVLVIVAMAVISMHTLYRFTKSESDGSQRLWVAAVPGVGTLWTDNFRKIVSNGKHAMTHTDY